METRSINNSCEMFRCKGENRNGVGKAGSGDILFLKMEEKITFLKRLMAAIQQRGEISDIGDKGHLLP